MPPRKLKQLSTTDDSSTPRSNPPVATNMAPLVGPGSAVNSGRRKLGQENSDSSPEKAFSEMDPDMKTMFLKFCSLIGHKRKATVEPSMQDDVNSEMAIDESIAISETSSIAEMSRLRKVTLPILDHPTEIAAHFRICRSQLTTAGFPKINSLSLRLKLLETIRNCRDAYAEGKSMVESIEWDQIEHDLVNNYADISKINSKVTEDLNSLQFDRANGLSFVTKCRTIYATYRELHIPTDGLLEKMLKKLPSFILGRLTERLWPNLNGRRIEQLPVLEVLRDLQTVVQQVNVVARLALTTQHKMHKDRTDRPDRPDRVLLANHLSERSDFVKKFAVCRYAKCNEIPTAVEAMVAGKLECRTKSGQTFFILGFNTTSKCDEVAEKLNAMDIKNHNYLETFPKNGWKGSSAARRQ
jgi:hypothetical protein